MLFHILDIRPRVTSPYLRQPSYWRRRQDSNLHKVTLERFSRPRQYQLCLLLQICDTYWRPQALGVKCLVGDSDLKIPTFISPIRPHRLCGMAEPPGLEPRLRVNVGELSRLLRYHYSMTPRYSSIVIPCSRSK